MRLKIFLFVSLLFGIVIIGIITLRYLEIDHAVEKSTSEISHYVKAMDEAKRQSILDYLDVSLLQMEDQIDGIFDRVQNLKWIEERLLPENYKKYPNHWKNSSVLMQREQWIDLIQTTAGDTVTSSIIVRPPYLNHSIVIPYSPTLSILIAKEKNDDFIAYIGVPYWSSTIKRVDGIVKKINTLEQDQKERLLLFTIDDLLQIKTEKLKVKEINWETNPLDSTIVIPHNTYVSVMENVADSIKYLQEELQNNPQFVAILQDKTSLAHWVAEQTKNGHLLWKNYSNQQQKIGIYQEINSKPWIQQESWSSRYEQNEMIWILGELLASGFWDFNPLAETAPKAICEYPRSYSQMPFFEAASLFVNTIVHPDLIHFGAGCKPIHKASCISKKFDIISLPDQVGVFFTKTMILKNLENNPDFPEYGSLTIGKSLNDKLQSLALLVAGNILFISTSGQKVLFHETGEINTNPTELWGDIDFSKFSNEKTGAIKDVKGKELLFIHFKTLLEGQGQIFIVQLKTDIFQILFNLQIKSKELLKTLLIQNTVVALIALLVTLWILNWILKKGISPLTTIANATKLISTGQLEDVAIPKAWKNRKDEVGTLCSAFDKMVIEMREAIKVRGILDKVVSKEIANKILKEGVQLGGELRRVTILFADIRNFTKITEHLNPKDVLDMLNNCLSLLSKVIDEKNGIIDKYIGDEVMALFGAPVDMKNPEAVAIECAQEMIQLLQNLNDLKQDQNLPLLKVGIGIHTGIVIAGNIGAENHLNYTVLGHNVNLASRIADHAGEMEILVTEDTLQSAQATIPIEATLLPPVQLKGISTPVTLYSVSTKSPTK